MGILKRIIRRINNSILNSYTKREKRDSMIMLCIACGIFAATIISHTIHNKSSEISLHTSDKLAKLSHRYQHNVESDTMNRLDSYIMKRYDTIELFAFDPNKASEKDLMKLGFTAKQAGNLLNYRNNGGKFKTADDLRKLYGMRTMQYKILKPYIEIAESARQKTKPQKERQTENKAESKPEKQNKQYFTFDPNTISHEDMVRLGFTEKQVDKFVEMRQKGRKFYVARDFASVFFVKEYKYHELEPYIKIDLEALMEGKQMYDINLAGIQELMEAGLSNDEAEKVVAFREKVGYFFASWQLSDCIDKSRAKTLKTSFYTCSSVEIRKIDINNATGDNIAAHPYFNDRQTNAVILLRQSKKIESIDDLKGCQEFGEWDIARIRNYITF